MEFHRLSETDLPRLAEWLERPHVSDWWETCGSLEEVREKYLPQSATESSATRYFAYLDGAPIGFIQSYVAVAVGDGWWEHENDPGVRGTDQFLADGERLGRGLGTQMVSEFTQFLFRDPSVTRIQADPSPENTRAIRCNEKAGFRWVELITTPDGPAVLMVLDRPGRQPSG